MSFPNQKTLTIVKSQITTPPFLQINEDDWQAAYRKLSPATFAVYLYLAQNQAGYHFDFSPTAIAKTGLMSKSTASQARKDLEKAGYIEDGRFYVESKEKREVRAKMFQEIDTTIK